VALGFAVALLPRDTTTIPGLSGAASAAQQTSARLDDPRQPGPQPAGAERPAPPAVRRAGKVLAVGDSVMLGASPALQRALGSRAVIDAAVSRQFAVGAGIIDQGLVRLKPDTVVVHLGNNGYVPFDELEALMKRLRGTQRVVLVNVRVPLQWQDSVNDALDYAASRYDNTVLVDWNEVSDRPGLLADGAHMTTEGARLYARAIARAVRAP
jgi:hypothetical protein